MANFFDSTIDKKSFAQNIRTINHIVVTYNLEDDDNRFKDWINDARFWLNDFAELLDPVIEDKVA